MKRFVTAFILGAVLLLLGSAKCFACTGIALTATDGSRVVARTVEWAASPMQCGYVVVPRGYRQQSLTPQGQDGLSFTSKYGYVGIWTEYEAIVVEGVNEKGLSAGLFFFPNYGKYPDFSAAEKSVTLSDMQLVSWVLSQFSTIDEVKAAISEVRVAGLDSRIGTVHWRISEPGGRVVVLEFTGGEPHFYENPLGVLTNSPGFEWQMLNLNNYVNLACRRRGAQPVRRQQRDARPAGRLHPSFKVRACGFLPDFRSGMAHGFRHRMSGLPYPEQFRCSRRSTARQE